MVHQAPAHVLVDVRLAVPDLRPVGRVRVPLGLVGEDPGELRVEARVVHLEDRERGVSQPRVAHHRDAVLGARQVLLDERGAARQHLAQLGQVGEAIASSTEWTTARRVMPIELSPVAGLMSAGRIEGMVAAWSSSLK